MTMAGCPARLDKRSSTAIRPLGGKALFPRWGPTALDHSASNNGETPYTSSSATMSDKKHFHLGSTTTNLMHWIHFFHKIHRQNEDKTSSLWHLPGFDPRSSSMCPAPRQSSGLYFANGRGYIYMGNRRRVVKQTSAPGLLKAGTISHRRQRNQGRRITCNSWLGVTPFNHENSNSLLIKTSTPPPTFFSEYQAGRLLWSGTKTPEAQCIYMDDNFLE